MIYSVFETAKAIRQKEVSAEAIMSAFLSRIEMHNKKINAFLHVNHHALERAKLVDKAVHHGQPLGPLAGVPIAIKDLLCTKGQPTTAGSKILANYNPIYNSTVVERLEAAGAIVIGKTNLDEFAMGSSNETSYFGNCRNPWNEQYVSGGSSGGSAAAVTAQMACAAIGTDTGGSIRQPANFCGIVGVKPTYGRVSRYGIIAYASSLDQAGPMTHTVQDAALLLEHISGWDRNDATTAKVPVPAFTQEMLGEIKGTRIGLPEEYFSDELDVDTSRVVKEAIASLKDMGAVIESVRLPLTPASVPIYYLIATSEASSNLARYDGVRYGYRSDFGKKPAEDLAEFYSRTRGEGFGTEVKRRIVLGTYCLSSGYYDAYYKKACQVRRLLRDEFLEAFKKCDVLLSPVTTAPAFKIGERIDDPLQMYLNDIYTTSTNLAGLPGMSVPTGFSKAGLPIGTQITAKHFCEGQMLKVARALESQLKPNTRANL